MNIRLLTLLSLCFFTSSVWAQSGIMQDSEAAAKKIAAARFDQEGLTDGEHQIVGRLSVRRQFLGTRATPAFMDVIQFHSFDGAELKFLKFADEELQQRLLKQLVNGKGIPVLIAANLEVKQVGHDGINMSTRITGTIESCEELSSETVAIAAATVGCEEEALKRYKESLKPEAISKDVAVSLGHVYVRSKTSRRGSGVSISNISAFNSSNDPATVSIKRLQIEQNGNAQKGRLSDPSGPETWEVEAQSWSDGVYEEGEMPQRLWAFEPADPIEPKEEVTIEIEIEINGEVVTLRRTVTPK